MSYNRGFSGGGQVSSRLPVVGSLVVRLPVVGGLVMGLPVVGVGGLVVVS